MSHTGISLKAGTAAVTLLIVSLACAQLVPTSQPHPPASQPTSQPASQPDHPGPTSRPTSRPANPLLTDAGSVLARRIAYAHGQQAWDKTRAIQFDLKVTFGESTLLEGTVLYDHRHGRVRIETENDETLVFDGERAWVSPADSGFKGARFHLLTWTYFMAAPFKLDDAGARLEETGLQWLDDKLCPTLKLTFEDGVGDSPDDWYLVYARPDSHELHAMAYIVTYGKDASKAQAEPHAIVYHGSTKVGAMTFARSWSFHNWSAEHGIVGDPIGRARLSRVKFVLPEDDDFERPADSVEDALPEGK